MTCQPGRPKRAVQREDRRALDVLAKWLRMVVRKPPLASLPLSPKQQAELRGRMGESPETLDELDPGRDTPQSN